MLLSPSRAGKRAVRGAELTAVRSGVPVLVPVVVVVVVVVVVAVVVVVVVVSRVECGSSDLAGFYGRSNGAFGTDCATDVLYRVFTGFFSRWTLQHLVFHVLLRPALINWLYCVFFNYSNLETGRTR